MVRTRLVSVGLLVAGLLAGAGDVSLAAVGTTPEGVPPPGPLYPAATEPYLSVGVGGGAMWASDFTLDTGFYAVGQFAVWLTPHVALEIDVGTTDLDDNFYGGELTVNPLIGYVVFSLPLTPGYAGAELVNYRLAVGVGRLSNRHSFTDVEDANVFALQSGTEWVLSSNAKLFVLFDMMWGDTVLGHKPIFDPGIGGPAIPFWDLETLTSFRIGVEFAF